MQFCIAEGSRIKVDAGICRGRPKLLEFCLDLRSLESSRTTEGTESKGSVQGWRDGS